MPPPPLHSTPDPARVRDLVLRYGWNSTAYQILNPGIEHFLAPNAPAVIGFVRAGRRWVAAGAPVCPPELLGPVVQQFESAARDHGAVACYVCAAARLESFARRSPAHATITIGAQPVWDPHDWPAIVSSRASLRAQLNRARNKRVRITLRPHPERAATDPDLRRCLAEWLARRPFPPLHFLTEPDTLAGTLDDRLLFVAERNDRPVGFLLASPVPCRNGYLLEQIVRANDAPNGTAELLIDTAMRHLASTGHTYATLGLVALAHNAGSELSRNPLWIRALTNWARAHGRRFYNFQGLESFRTKLAPQSWEPIYAISNEPTFTPATLHAIAEAFCNRSPALAFATAVARAARQELRWLTARLRPS